MVILLTSILAVFIVPRVTLIQSFDDIGYRDKVRGALEFARKTAIAQRRNVQVTLAANNLTLTIANDTPEGAGATTYARALALPVPDRACGGPVNMVCAPANVTLGGTSPLVFSPLGRPTTGAAAYTVTGAQAFNIVVEAESGHVR